MGKTNLIHDENPCTITGSIRAKDVDYLPKVADHGWNGDSVIYSHLSGMFSLIQLNLTPDYSCYHMWFFVTKLFECQNLCRRCNLCS